MLEGQGAETQMLAAVNHLSASFVLRVRRQNLSSVGLFARLFRCIVNPSPHLLYSCLRFTVRKFLEAGSLDYRGSVFFNY